MTSRRKFLTNTATAGISTLALSMFPPSIRRALAIPANNETGTIKDVKHVVILMQENRAFDHYFGTLKGVRGFGDRFTIPEAGGLTVWHQRDANGAPVLPFHLDGATGNAQRFSGTPHTWVDTQNAWDGGRMSEWARYKNPAAMGYFKEAEIPFQFALANAFTICDDYHCAMHTGTHANRMMHATGTNGAPFNATFVNNFSGDFTVTTSDSAYFHWTTYAERLEKTGVTWKVYQNIRNTYGTNPLLGFKQFRKANEALPQDRQVNSSLSQAEQPVYDPADATQQPLIKGYANTMPTQDDDPNINANFIQAFRDDVLNGRLPEVSWISPTDVYSEHPGPSSPTQGAWFVQQFLDALTDVPEVWSKTVFIVNYDENDGYFDHLPPATPPSPLGDGSYAGKTTLSDEAMAVEYYTQDIVKRADTGASAASQSPQDGQPYGPGPRVPMYVISPWSRGGWVNSQTFDHTSVLRFLEARFGVKEENISPYRYAVCGDLTSAFNFADPNHEPLPVLAGRRTKAEADQLRNEQQTMPKIVPPVNGELPVQETGTRPSRALPYQLHTSALVDAIGGKVQLLFANSGEAAAVFHVYDKLHLDRLPRRYMVEAGTTLDDAWDVVADDGHYDLWVLGPNGFHRHFVGDVSMQRGEAAASPEVRVCYDVANGNVYLEMRNDGKASCNFTVKALVYRDDGPWTATVDAGGKTEQHWDLADSGCWYDFVVTCDADPAYQRRFAGRVETGRHGVSDPAMGVETR